MKTIKQEIFTFTAILFAGMLASAQTQVDLSSQSRKVDFSAALSTKPIRTGAVLPATCSSGEAFFLTTAAAGANLQFCANANSWMAQGGVAPAPSPVSAGPAVTQTGAATLAVGGNCSLAAFCYARVAGVSYSYVGASTVTISAGTPTVRIYISDGTDGAPAGTVKVRNSLASGVSCSAGCMVENSQTSFPGMSIPLALWAASSPGLWDATGQDQRASLSTGQNPSAGGGISISQGSSTSIAVDTTVIPRKFSGSGAPATVALSSLGDFYSDVANNDTYQCFQAGPCTAPGAGNWVKVDGGSAPAAQTTIGGLYATYNNGTFYPLYASNGLPDATAFSWMNQPPGAAKSVVGGHAIHLSAPAPSVNGNNLTILRDGTALSSSTFTVQGAFVGCSVPAQNDSSLCAIGLTDGTRVVSFGLTLVYGSYAVAVLTWNNPTTMNSVISRANGAGSSVMAYKIVLFGGNLGFYLSLDGGASYDLVSSGAASSFFPSVSSLNAVWMLNNNWTYGLSSATLVDWKVQ